MAAKTNAAIAARTTTAVSRLNESWAPRMTSGAATKPTRRVPTPLANAFARLLGATRWRAANQKQAEIAIKSPIGTTRKMSRPPGPEMPCAWLDKGRARPSVAPAKDRAKLLSEQRKWWRMRPNV